MKKLLTWIWCFPQMLAGVIVKWLTKAENWGDHYRFAVKCGSVSLGTYIFICPGHWDDATVIKHELGHTKQSYILGWLYIPVILIPSMIWAGCFQKYREKHNVSYYSFYTERWADKLAGIER